MADDPRVDGGGHAIDDFEITDDLMMIGALESGADSIADDFDQAVTPVAESLLRPQAGERYP